jgi:hypothetical protein
MRVLHCVAVMLGLLCATQIAQAQLDTVWTKQIASGSGLNLRAVTALTGGDFAVCGFQMNQAGDTNMFVARIAADATMIWTRTCGVSSLSESGNALVELANGNVMVIGYNEPTNSTALVVWGLSAQGDSLWTRNYSYGTPTKGFGACRLPDGNVAAVGYTSAPSYRMWLLKLAPSGDTLWTHLYGGTGYDYGYRVTPGQGGTLVIGGYSWDTGGQHDFWLLRTDSLGHQLSSRTLGTAGIDEVSYALAVSDTEIYLGGRIGTYRSLAGGFRLDGSPIWNNVYENPNWPQEILRDMAPQAGGGVFCVGWNTLEDSTDYYPWTFIVDPNGAQQNVRSYGLYGGQLWGVTAVPGRTSYIAVGTVIVGAETRGIIMRFGTSPGISGTVRRSDDHLPIISSRVGVVGQPWYTFTDSQGRFYLNLHPGSYDVVASATCVSPDTARRIVILPDSISVHDFILGSPHLIIHQTSLNGVVHNHMPASIPCRIWNAGDAVMVVQTSAMPVRPASTWLAVEPATALVPAGDSLTLQVRISPDTADNAAYDYDGFIILHSNWCTDSVVQIPVLVAVLDVQQPAGNLPDAFTLHPAYPNPFNAVITVHFDVPRRADVSAILYDILGREVRRLLDEPLDAGFHQLRFDLRDLPSGLYFLRMSSGSFTAGQKLFLLK